MYKSKYISDYAKCVLCAKTLTLPTQEQWVTVCAFY